MDVLRSPLVAMPVLGLVGCLGPPPELPPELPPAVASSTGSQLPDDTGVITTGSDSTEGTLQPDTTSGTPTADDTTESGSDVLLAISDGPHFDFGDTSVGMLVTHQFTVINEGDIEATGIEGLTLGSPFEYTGGTYPGAGGTCSSALASGDWCTVDVSFVPSNLGLFSDTLSIAYDQTAAAICELTGGGAGASANLLLNPGGEAAGSPPPSWNNTGPGTWAAGMRAGEVLPHTGSGFIHADTGPYFQDYSLTQDVDVSVWAATIDRGLMRFSFEGQTRVLAAGNDQSRIRVDYLDAAQSPIDSWDTGWRSDTAWNLQSSQGAVPSGTRVVRVDLGCTKTFGDTCDAYFDALELVAVYP